MTDIKKRRDIFTIQQTYGLQPDTDCKFDAYQAEAGKPNFTSNFTTLKDHSTIWILYDPDLLEHAE